MGCAGAVFGGGGIGAIVVFAIVMTSVFLIAALKNRKRKSETVKVRREKLK